jgi:two-component system chemotaxis response regulator CheY
MNILIVDDELVGRTKLEKVLGVFGDITAVDNIEEARTAFRRAWDDLMPYDLVCLDINMPESSGLELLEDIRDFETQLELDRSARSVIVMITAMSDRENVTRALALGCDDYIVKPFEKTVLRKKVRHLVYPDHVGPKDPDSLLTT